SVTGGDAPAAVSSFEELEFPAAVQSNMQRAGYTKPTALQQYVLPAALLGKNVMVTGAITGRCGRAASYLLPTVARLLSSELPPRDRRQVAPSAIVLSPTRELAQQVFAEARKACYGAGVRPVACFGGAPLVDQLRELERGCELLVATPGRLGDLMERSPNEPVDLSIHEQADRMLDMGFEPQIRKIVLQSEMPPAEERQTLVFSATHPPEMKALALDCGRDYVSLTAGPGAVAGEHVAQRMERVAERDKAS
ncbi:hypothetical protein EMIHUDRAFT_44497, partial [Emiliania huxleyi CCMP1516]|uniref:RNA helicase n=2 Tax=Emiliania huxleyi TaxID=2903 RepID=A0A0D3IAF9_EMIH1